MITESGQQAPEDIDEALWLFQQDLPTLVKDKSGQVGNQKTKYADLAQANDVVLTRLNALGCIWVCEPQMMALADQLRFVLRWELKHVASDTRRTGDFPILGDSPMKHGAAITYARRYSLLAVTGVIPEDEDDDAQSFEDGHAVARRPASGRSRAPRTATARPVETVSPPARSGRAAPPLPGETPPPVPVPAPGDSPRLAPPPDDPHDPADPSDPGTIHKRQRDAMHALFGELGYGGDENRAVRLEISRKLAGLDTLATSNDLSYEQADRVNERLRQRRDQRKAARDAQAGAPQGGA